MLDLSNEQDQREIAQGPVPAGSMVLVSIEVLEPKHPAQENRFISEAKSGLRQLYCKFTVEAGQYEGVSFRENITLPVGSQQIRLTSGQTKACNIGGATLKGMCLAARKPPKMQDVTSLTGLKFPVRVGINDTPSEKDGRTYWNNTIMSVITPDKEAYAVVANGGEIITDGPVTGKGKPSSSQQNDDYPEWMDQNKPPCDDVPW